MAQIYFRQNAGNWNNSGTANPATGVGGFSLTAMPGPYLPAFSGGTGGGGSFLQSTIAPGHTVGTPATFNLKNTYTKGADRNNFSGFLGIQFTATNSGSVSSLGVCAATGNTGNLTVYLLNSSSVVLGSVAINLTGSTAGTFYYGSITPAAITAGASYRIVAQAVSGTNFNDVASCTVNNATGVTGVFNSGPVTAGYSTFGSGSMYFGFDAVIDPTSFTTSLIETPPSGASNWSSAMLWDVATLTNTMALLEFGLVAQLGGTTSGGVKGTVQQGATPGLYYFEQQLSLNPQNVFIGISTVGATLPTASTLANTAHIVNDGHIYVNGTSVASGLTLGNSDIIGIALSVPAAAGHPSNFFL